MLSGCASKTQDTFKAPSPTAPTKEVYDQKSWETIIEDTCVSFSDGCNTCRRMPDGGAACTRKGCSRYEKPKCLDEETASEGVKSEYIGLTVEEASELAKTKDVPFRVIEKDGQPLPATMDWRPGRINASVKEGVVVDISIEGQE